MKKVSDFMTRDLISVTEETPLRQVVEIFSWRSLSGLPVVNQKNEVIGFISEKDVIAAIFPAQVRVETPDVVGLADLAQVIKKVGQIGGLKVKDYMSKNPATVSEDQSALDVASLMLKNDLKRLPVVRQGKMVGIVDRASLCRALLEELPE